MRWVSDDGEAEVYTYGHQRIARVPGRSTVLLWPRGGQWLGRTMAIDDVDAVAVTMLEGGELLVAHSWMRPWADGTEANPRSGSREWRCARVIEEKS